MKPSADDFRFWEARTARTVPAWARVIDARRRDPHYGGASAASHLHAAINGRAGGKPSFADLDKRNAIVRLWLQRKHIQEKGYALAAKRKGFARVTTLADYMRVMLEERPVQQRGGSRSSPTYARLLRRMGRP